MRGTTATIPTSEINDGEWRALRSERTLLPETISSALHPAVDAFAN